MRSDFVPGKGRLDERGVALPLALFGLVALTILVTSALLTSSTELALSNAHQDGTRGLYAAEGALEGYVANRASALPANQRLVTGNYTTTAGGQNFRVAVAQMARGEMVTWGQDSVTRTETYSLLTSPSNGRGRSTGALIEISRMSPFFQLNVNSGLTVGGSVTVAGNSTVSDGRNTSCDLEGKQAENALQVSAGATITQQGASAVIEGKADTASFTKAEMVQLILKGMTLAQAAENMATFRFSTGQLGSRKPSSLNASNQPRLLTDSLNWGCPKRSDLSCTTVSGNQANLNHFPIVAIDGGGGEVGITGDHGQGILIVHNGSLRITGNFTYNGIILVERDLFVMGTGGGQGVKLEGAVVAFGENTDITDNVSGNAVITYNKCVIEDAQRAGTETRLDLAAQRLVRPTFAWFEVVR